jgi:hypothetical protein
MVLDGQFHPNVGDHAAATPVVVAMAVVFGTYVLLGVFFWVQEHHICGVPGWFTLARDHGTLQQRRRFVLTHTFFDDVLPGELSGHIWPVRFMHLLGKEHLWLRLLFGRDKIHLPNILKLASRSLNIALIATLFMSNTFDLESKCRRFDGDEVRCKEYYSDVAISFAMDSTCHFSTEDSRCTAPRPAHVAIIVLVSITIILSTAMHRIAHWLCTKIHTLLYRRYSRQQALLTILNEVTSTGGSSHGGASTPNIPNSRGDVLEFGCLQSLTNTMLRGACLAVMRSAMDEVALSYEAITIVNEAMCIDNKKANLDVADSLQDDGDYYSKLKSQKTPATAKPSSPPNKTSPRNDNNNNNNNNNNNVRSSPTHKTSHYHSNNVNLHTTHHRFQNEYSPMNQSREQSEHSDLENHSYHSHNHSSAPNSVNQNLINAPQEDGKEEDEDDDEEGSGGGLLSMNALLKLSRLDELLLQDVDAAYARKMIQTSYRFHAVLTSRKLKKARREALEIASFLELQHHTEMEKNLYLIKKFVVGCLDKYDRARFEDLFFRDFEAITTVSSFAVCKEYLAVVCVLGYFVVALYYILNVGAGMGSIGSSLWLQGFLVAMLLDVVVLQSMDVLVEHVILPHVGNGRVRAVHGLLRERTHTVMKRRLHLFQVSQSLVQHFNPACRAARLVPHLPAARLLMSITDNDFPEVLIRMHSDSSSGPHREDEDDHPDQQMHAPRKRGAMNALFSHNVKLFVYDFIIAVCLSFVCIALTALLFDATFIGAIVVAACLFAAALYLLIFQRYSQAHDVNHQNMVLRQVDGSLFKYALHHWFRQTPTEEPATMVTNHTVPMSMSNRGSGVGVPVGRQPSNDMANSNGNRAITPAFAGTERPAYDMQISRGNYRQYWFTKRLQTQRSAYGEDPSGSNVIHVSNSSGRSSRKSTTSSNPNPSSKGKVVPVSDDVMAILAEEGKLKAAAMLDSRESLDEFDPNYIRRHNNEYGGSAMTQGTAGTARSTPNSGANQNLGDNNTSNTNSTVTSPRNSHGNSGNFNTANQSGGPGSANNSGHANPNSKQGSLKMTVTSSAPSTVPHYLIQQKAPFSSASASSAASTAANTAAQTIPTLDAGIAAITPAGNSSSNNNNSDARTTSGKPSSAALVTSSHLVTLDGDAVGPQGSKKLGSPRSAAPGTAMSLFGQLQAESGLNDTDMFFGFQGDNAAAADSVRDFNHDSQ